ncbi:methyltransferase [Aliidiomarina iranensis]|uniref:Methyltransferase n=1 Tax=Aliidiomarina iranensis TaxID=1434071 RepID=A0A432VR53_9GAMM|nr:class I SAM-dependent methyltransferase [Aliidiomarina iranensis]RUO18746.1 methyltransferase [Aliidiomarina iranensis]
MPRKTEQCPLCREAIAGEPWFVETRAPLQGREHFQCMHCHVVFVPQRFHVSDAEAKALYELHENNPNDIGYRKFLARAAEPVQRLLPQGSSGLDFGSGPGPTLSLMLNEAGFPCSIFDIFYANNPERLQQTYDFITSTEVFEHLAQPRQVLNQLVPLLNHGGLLVIMTQRPKTIDRYQKWTYLLDPTHITFFRDETFQWIAQHWPLELIELHKDVAVLQKR